MGAEKEVKASSGVEANPFVWFANKIARVMSRDLVALQLWSHWFWSALRPTCLSGLRARSRARCRFAIGGHCH
eukprot:8910257-Lingulodinium_polyedra.AAC.1